MIISRKYYELSNQLRNFFIVIRYILKKKLIKKL